MARSCVREVGFRFHEVRGNLFSCSNTTSLAHCISEDVRMGKGIAVTFKKNFGGVGELRSQGKKPGEVSILERDGRYIYYLVTKPKYFHKPTYETLQNSLKAMKEHCEQHTVKTLAMPRIGCGLDKLEWTKVREIIKDTFKDSDMEITVYSL